DLRYRLRHRGHVQAGRRCRVGDGHGRLHLRHLHAHGADGAVRPAEPRAAYLPHQFPHRLVLLQLRAPGAPAEEHVARAVHRGADLRVRQHLRQGEAARALQAHVRRDGKPGELDVRVPHQPRLEGRLRGQPDGAPQAARFGRLPARGRRRAGRGADDLRGVRSSAAGQAHVDLQERARQAARRARVMKRLVLISPPPPGNVGEENVSVLTQMPLSLAYLKALTPGGWEVDIIDEMKEPALTADETGLTFDGADLVGITAMSHQAPRAYQIANV